MITIAVVDKQAESRARIIDELSRFLQSQARDLDLLPRINLIPLSRQEIKFHAAPDICVVGPEILGDELIDLTAIRKIFPQCSLFARLRAGEDDLQSIEQLARLGVDEVLTDKTSPSEFLRKLIFLSRRASKGKTGTLIVVDGGKGGVGVTSIAAGLGDALAALGKRTALVDLDFDTQDLSRFLQARPFVNENLQLLFDQSRPATEEFVDQCFVPVWDDEELLRCMPPVAESDTLFDSRSSYPRTLISILEVVDSRHDFVVIDAGAARGALRRTIYRLADAIVFVVTNDPASLYASVDRLKQAAGSMAADSKLLLLMNGATRDGVPPATLREEFLRILAIPHLEVLGGSIPRCRLAARWPGSGETLRSSGNAAVRRGFDALLADLGIIERPVAHSRLAELFESCRKVREQLRSTAASKGSNQALPAPASPVRTLPGARIEEQLKALPVPSRPPAAADLRDLIGTVQFS